MPRIKISQAAKEFNVSISRVVEELQKKGIIVDEKPNTRLEEEAYDILVKAFQPDRKAKARVEEMRQGKDKTEPAKEPESQEPEATTTRQAGPRIVAI